MIETRARADLLQIRIINYEQMPTVWKALQDRIQSPTDILITEVHPP